VLGTEDLDDLDPFRKKKIDQMRVADDRCLIGQDRDPLPFQVREILIGLLGTGYDPCIFCVYAHRVE
jgi:hypothetical protein